jgi:hypothetical protein
MLATQSSILEPIQDLLKVLDEYGIKYKYDAQKKIIKIRCRANFLILNSGSAFEFYQGKNKIIAFGGVGRFPSEHDYISVWVYDKSNYSTKYVLIPANVHISYYKGYLHIEFIT